MYDWNRHLLHICEINKFEPSLLHDVVNIPDPEKHRTAFTPLFASQLPVLFVRADID